MFALFSVVQTCTLFDSFQEFFHKLVEPTPDWGPALPKFRKGRYAPDPNENGDIWSSEMSPKYANLEGVITPSTDTLESDIISTKL